MMAYSNRNRSACIRIPAYSDSPNAKRIEYRCPDPSSNPYLAFAAMLMAGIDGILNRIEPGKPMDMDLYEAGRFERATGAGFAGSSPERTSKPTTSSCCGAASSPRT